MSDAVRHILAVCPSCRRSIRIPAGRLRDDPRCPGCKTAIFPGHPLDLDEAGFDDVIGRSDLPVLVDFWAAWCAPCRAFAPTLERVAGEAIGQLVVARVDTDAAPRLSARHAIRSIPTVALFRGGREIARSAGAMPFGALTDWLARHGAYGQQER